LWGLAATRLNRLLSIDLSAVVGVPDTRTWQNRNR